VAAHRSERITLSAVLCGSGIATDIRVIKGLSDAMDEEAIKAARMWLFRPARDRDNKPVPIVITLELTFALH